VSDSLVAALPLCVVLRCHIVSLYKSALVGSSETEHRDRGTTRENGSTTPTAQKASTWRIRQRVGFQTTLMAWRRPQQAKQECWRSTHPEGPQGKRRKHIENGVNPAAGSALGLATVATPHPSAAKKLEAPALCEKQADTASLQHMRAPAAEQVQRLRQRRPLKHQRQRQV